MRNRYKYSIPALWLACAVFAPGVGHADDGDDRARWHVGAFTEPLTFALSGYSIGVEVRPAPISRLATTLPTASSPGHLWAS